MKPPRMTRGEMLVEAARILDANGIAWDYGPGATIIVKDRQGKRRFLHPTHTSGIWNVKLFCAAYKDAPAGRPEDESAHAV